MIVYNVMLNSEVKEIITPVYADAVVLYYIMRDYWLPKMTAKYGKRYS